MKRLVHLGAAVVAAFAWVALHAQGGGGTGPGPGGGPMIVNLGPPVSVTIEEGPAAISGVVIDGATKAPVPDAIVYLGNDGSGTVGSQNRQVTDTRGRFAFVNLPAKNRLTLSASKPGYLPGGFSRDSGAGRSGGIIDLKEGQWVSDAQVVLWKPGAIGGSITDERGEPVVGVYVHLLARIRVAGGESLAGGPVTKTDDRGAYRFSGLTPGHYMVVVPSVQSSVQANAPDPNPAPPNTPAANAPPEPALDDDPATRLVLRNYPIPPPSHGGVRNAYPITFAPGGTSLASAGVIDLNFGDERGGVDVQLRPVTTWRVSGLVQGPPESIGELTLRLVPQGFERLGLGSEAATAYVGPDGQFTFLNVPDGTYMLDAPRSAGELRLGASIFGTNFPPPPRPGYRGFGSNSEGLDSMAPGVSIENRSYRTAPNFFGRTTITVNGKDETGVVVPMRAAGTMTVTVRKEGSEPPPGVFRPEPATMMRLDPADGDPARGPLRTDWRPNTEATVFKIEGLMPGPYRLRVSGPWGVKSITWQGRDYTNAPFDAATTQDFPNVDVLVTDAKPVVTGTVRAADGSPSANAFVIAFPVDETQWTNRGLMPPRFGTASASRTGAFRMTLPAGEYFVKAIDPADNTRRFDPEFMKTASATAAKITVGWGETANMELSVR